MIADSVILGDRNPSMLAIIHKFTYSDLVFSLSIINSNKQKFVITISIFPHSVKYMHNL